jgi:hypothetical protein
MKTIVRGNPFVATVTFLASDGSALSPASAILYVTYYTNHRPKTDQVAMAQVPGGNQWTASWDTSNAETGDVAWCARASNPSAAVQGEFTLGGNAANPGPKDSPSPDGYPYFM